MCDISKDFNFCVWNYFCNLHRQMSVDKCVILYFLFNVSKVQDWGSTRGKMFYFFFFILVFSRLYFFILVFAVNSLFWILFLDSIFLKFYFITLVFLTFNFALQYFKMVTVTSPYFVFCKSLNLYSVFIHIYFSILAFHSPLGDLLQKAPLLLNCKNISPFHYK